MDNQKAIPIRYSIYATSNSTQILYTVPDDCVLHIFHVHFCCKEAINQNQSAYMAVYDTTPTQSYYMCAHHAGADATAPVTTNLAMSYPEPLVLTAGESVRAVIPSQGLVTCGFTGLLFNL